MQSTIVEILVVAFAGLAAFGLRSQWLRLTRNTAKGAIVVARKGSTKTVTLPENYSPSAVQALTELFA